MDTNHAITALGALAHEHRLAAYRLLVERGLEGLPAGTIAERIGLVPSSLTFHLQHLERAGLVTRRRVGRQLIYAADYTSMSGLVTYLTDNCCAQASAACAPACAAPARARPSKKARRAS
jgi:ArsR family transcriptional regulator, arsenate/arsenite/antimonite-responsive transcriptional repressor